MVHIHIHRQMHPFYETMMLLAHTDDFSQMRLSTIEALNEMGLEGEKFYRSYMSIYEKYVNAFYAHKQPEPDNAFWTAIEGDGLLISLINLLWSYRENTSKNKSAEDIQAILAEIFSETDLKVDLKMIQSGRPDELMSAIDHTDMCSKDKWVLLQILLNPEDTVHRMLQWIDLNIGAFHSAFAVVESEYTALLDKYIPCIEEKNNHFRGIIDGLESVSEIYPSLASPLSQFAFDETAFCGMLTYALDDLGTDKVATSEALRVGWKVLADKSKMEILRLLKSKPMYNQEIAETLGLTAATVSYHMNAILACHFVTISKSDGRVYYHLKTQELDALINQTRALLVD